MDLLDICKIGGVSVKKFDGKKKYIATGDIIDNKITSYEIVDYNRKPSRANIEIKNNDVLFAKMIDTVKVLKADDNNVNNIYSTGFYCMTPNDNVLQDYLYYYFNSDSFNSQKNKNCSGATQKAINNEGLKKIKIKLLPDIEDQNIIVQKLYNLDNLIAIKKEEINKLNLLIKSQFVEMFGTPFLNEKKWENGCIRDLVSEVKYGTSKPANKGGKYKYLRMNNITYDGKLDLSDLKYIDIKESELDKCSTKRGDILFNRTNSRELVGKTCVYNWEEKMVIAGFVIRVRVNEKANPYFISTYLNTKYLKNKLYNMCKNASGQSNINAQELQNIEIYMPPIELQNKFAQIVEQIDKQKFEFEKSLKKLQELQSSLMQEYFG